MAEEHAVFRGLTEQQALDWVNLHFKLAGMNNVRAVHVTGKDARLLVALSQRGAFYYMPVFDQGPMDGQLGIRSILKPKKKMDLPRFMINGQPLPGTEAKAVFGEQGPRYLPSEDALRRWVIDDLNGSEEHFQAHLEQARAQDPEIGGAEPRVRDFAARMPACPLAEYPDRINQLEVQASPLAP